jgi:acetyl esterase/lipase
MKKEIQSIFVGVLLLAGFPGVCQDNNNALHIPEDIIVEKNLEYAVTDGKTLLLDLYMPANTNQAPLVIWVHGGAWKGGSKNNPQHAVKLLDDGFAVASINYRLSQEAIFPAQIVDCKAAVRWLRANAGNYDYNAEKIGVWGSSAGGHLVALMGTSGNLKRWDLGENLDHSSAVQAVCDWYGPSDFLKMDDLPGSFAHLDENSPESMLIGGDIRKHPEKVREANPISYISENTPPFLIMHGKKDRTVIHQQSILLHDALKAHHIDSELILLENAGHGGKLWENQVSLVSEFFNTTLNSK